MSKNKWFLNGGRGSGKTVRLICEVYENKIAELEKKNAELSEQLLAVSEQLRLAKDNAYAKTIIQDLLDNSDEYARERAINFLKESK